ncbi:uncharacterized protein LOC131183272 [Hevea brasiliensis]|uniref:uncharacterized protein LOC131183272 n=1 Tax=Hevea brasiliensis TaxID=3981 RepID=UPI0025FF36D6|nr:uncharacterized protein LOC131183272 [Hevea brasiliensis]
MFTNAVLAFFGVGKSSSFIEIDYRDSIDQQVSRSAYCETCGKIHGGECYWATGACFNCGGKGHLARDCTNAPRYGPAPTTAEGSIQSPAPRGSQSVGRGRGRGRGTASGSQGTIGQSGQGSASTRIYAMKQREEAETSDVVAVEKNIGKEPEEPSRG